MKATIFLGMLMLIAVFSETGSEPLHKRNAPSCPPNNQFGICQMRDTSCSSDGDCNSGYMCCTVGCNRECVRPN